MTNDATHKEPQAAGQESGLFAEFPPPSYEDWLKAIEKMLKGGSFEKKLVTKTYEGIRLQPMYRRQDTDNLAHIHSLPGFAPYVRGNRASGYLTESWAIAQELPYSTPSEMNEALRTDIERGQNAVNLVLDRATAAGIDADVAPAEDVGHQGTSLSSLNDLATALDGIDLAQMPILVQAGSAAVPLAALLIAHLQNQGVAPESLHGSIQYDPLGTLALEGALPYALESAYDRMAALTGWAAKHAPHVQTITVNGHPYHNGGGSAVQELAFGLATGVTYLRAMQDRGLAIDTVAPHVLFSFSLGSNFFMEVAKLRAARLLWASIVKAFGGSDAAQKVAIHVRTSAYNKTIYDPYVNMLRTTTEAFSGVLGGCDSMYISPFDTVVRIPDFFSRRVARNTHIVLEQECNLNKVIDPAGGSWYVEHLTDALAQESWKLFQEIEKQGGLFPALQAGFPQQEVARVAAERAKNIALRKDVFVGTNLYPNLKEKPAEVPHVDIAARQNERVTQLKQYRASVDQAKRQAALQKLSSAHGDMIASAAAAALAGATVGEIAQALGQAGGPTVKPVDVHRATAAFETLRAASEVYAARTGARPKVFLANMGPIPQHKPRADFATGFFEVGGFEVITNTGFSTPEAAAQAASQSGAPVVVICSTDTTYPELVPPLTKLIKQANPDASVILAGYPSDQIEAHKQAGVDEFIHMRANCYDILLGLQKKIGVV